MARNTRTYTVLICDFCGKEDETVENRKFQIDKSRRQLEACGDCWPVATVKELLDTGRRVRKDSPGS